MDIGNIKGVYGVMGQVNIEFRSSTLKLSRNGLVD